MARESAEDKGRRYAAEGRLTVVQVDGDQIRAMVRGVGEFYECGHNPSGWWCDCPASTRCSHLYALMLVTIANRKEAHVG